MAIQKDTDSFLKVIDSHKGLLYKIADSYCKNESQREDLIQEIILQLWRAFPKFDSKFKHSTWIYRIALNVSISFYRKERKRVRPSDGNTDNLIYLDSDSDRANKSLKLNLLKAFIEKLKPLNKALILLYLEGKSHNEISDILGISVSNVGTKISRIKRELKSNFDNLKIKENE